MAIEWKLFADLAEYADDKHVAVDVSAGDTVGDALEELLEDVPALEGRVLDDGELRSQINVLRNGTNVLVEADGLETELEDGDELALFPPVSGG
ncbi:ubiquitin-like small modifier protein 1 [Natronobacterium gregoryi]|uniref:MoaD family protein n=2 Tax=Natronobacterium gregoryi TaxID=44930 RepID=L0AGY9_NATGS|nr:ubiquitin-like small modifier protein 1 [Natronobacterium gregoryi]AFZ72355.1 MoaD family protein [Natronobacterium gregoryi SP2]ELY64260.1 MoaD family protein [Natronobacterium gregoryi SP2]PLK20330.1 MoaD/ThiS family protein [Natronobacterium gregoryi SP2]SFJ22491.1 ubiquitin-like small archaeal modifier protein (SAMP) [Natronobacterium gregoryi]